MDAQLKNFIGFLTVLVSLIVLLPQLKATFWPDSADLAYRVTEATCKEAIEGGGERVCELNVWIDNYGNRRAEEVEFELPRGQLVWHFETKGAEAVTRGGRNILKLFNLVPGGNVLVNVKIGRPWKTDGSDFELQYLDIAHKDGTARRIVPDEGWSFWWVIAYAVGSWVIMIVIGVVWTSLEPKEKGIARRRKVIEDCKRTIATTEKQLENLEAGRSANQDEPAAVAGKPDAPSA